MVVLSAGLGVENLDESSLALESTTGCEGDSEGRELEEDAQPV
jgi:hypothetical protein